MNKKHLPYLTAILLISLVILSPVSMAYEELDKEDISFEEFQGEGSFQLVYEESKERISKEDSLPEGLYNEIFSLSSGESRTIGFKTSPSKKDYVMIDVSSININSKECNISINGQKVKTIKAKAKHLFNNRKNKILLKNIKTVVKNGKAKCEFDLKIPEFSKCGRGGTEYAYHYCKIFVPEGKIKSWGNGWGKCEDYLRELEIKKCSPPSEKMKLIACEISQEDYNYNLCLRGYASQYGDGFYDEKFVSIYSHASEQTITQIKEMGLMAYCDMNYVSGPTPWHKKQRYEWMAKNPKTDYCEKPWVSPTTRDIQPIVNRTKSIEKTPTVTVGERPNNVQPTNPISKEQPTKEKTPRIIVSFVERITNLFKR